MSDAIQTGVVVEQWHPELLLYDYFKHISTLSLVALGGMLSIAQAYKIVGEGKLIVAVLLAGASGAWAMAALDKIIRAKTVSKPIPKSLHFDRYATSGTFFVGVGAFLSVFLKGAR